jgi:hypothetical protein
MKSVRLLFSSLSARHSPLTRNRIRVGWNAINRNSAVAVTASECLLRPDGSIEQFIGDARLRVECIAPYDGGMEFVIMVNWQGPGPGFPVDYGLPSHLPLKAIADVTVLDDPIEVHHQ